MVHVVPDGVPLRGPALPRMHDVDRRDRGGILDQDHDIVFMSDEL